MVTDILPKWNDFIHSFICLSIYYKPTIISRIDVCFSSLPYKHISRTWKKFIFNWSKIRYLTQLRQNAVFHLFHQFIYLYIYLFIVNTILSLTLISCSFFGAYDITRISVYLFVAVYAYKENHWTRFKY